MKCDYCGSNLNIEDKVCPYCHQPNKHYVKHRQDMFHYETDYQNTKSEVYEKAGKVSRRAVRIAVLAVMGMLVLGALLVNIYEWEIQRAIRIRQAKRHLTEYQAQLDDYIQQQDWYGYDTYMSELDLTYYDMENEEFAPYQQFARLTNNYGQILLMCSRLVQYGNTEYDYYEPDECMENIADELTFLYKVTQRDGYSYYEDLYEKHQDWCEALISQAEALVQTYVGVDEEVFTSQSIRQMSNTKILVLLERSYEKDE